MYNMDFSTIVNIVLCILSFLLAAISVIIVVISIRQNNKMIEESTRPYISIYIESITICEQSSFFVLKNFGHTSATIDLFEYDSVLKETHQANPNFNKQFDYINGLSLSPGQSKLFQYNVTLLPKDSISFRIKYSSFKKHYEESINLNVKNYIHIPVPRPTSQIPENNARQVNTLREILEHLI